MHPGEPGKSGGSVNLLPFLRWAGGKRWFANEYGTMIPRRFSRYIEPFLGGGALYFHLRPAAAVLGDVNPELIQTYLAIREDHSAVENYLHRHARNHTSEYYYEVRGEVPTCVFEQAAPIHLPESYVLERTLPRKQEGRVQRTCWNTDEASSWNMTSSTWWLNN